MGRCAVMCTCCDPDKLPITLEHDIDQGAEYWVARNPDLPGCIADGETPEEAVRNLRVARLLYVAHLGMSNMSLCDVLHRESNGDNYDDAG